MSSRFTDLSDLELREINRRVIHRLRAHDELLKGVVHEDGANAEAKSSASASGTISSPRHIVKVSIANSAGAQFSRDDIRTAFIAATKKLKAKV